MGPTDDRHGLRDADSGSGSYGYGETETASPLAGQLTLTISERTVTSSWNSSMTFRTVVAVSAPGHMNFSPFGAAFVDPPVIFGLQKPYRDPVKVKAWQDTWEKDANLRQMYFVVEKESDIINNPKIQAGVPFKYVVTAAGKIVIIPQGVLKPEHQYASAKPDTDEVKKTFGLVGRHVQAAGYAKYEVGKGITLDQQSGHYGIFKRKEPDIKIAQDQAVAAFNNIEHDVKKTAW